MAEIKPQIETFAKIKVIGVGGSGGSSTNRMIASKIRGVEFIAMNTDVQALHASQAPQKLHIGKSITRGLGCGMDPEIGFKAAEESQNEIREMIKGADMVFVTCGLGGGTGSGASPYIANVARELGALTVAVVTKPFSFEGAARKAIAEAAFEKLAANVDTIITIPNDRVLQIIDKKTSLLEAFEMVDDVLRQGVQGISELITQHGNINVDFADVRAIMANRGSALMGIGHGHGDNRAADAAKAAIASPLLEVSVDGAKGILFTITGGSNLGLYELNEAAKVITESADPTAKVIFGAVIDESLKDEVKVTVIATGFDQRVPNIKPKTIFASGSMAPASAHSAPATYTAPPASSYTPPPTSYQPPAPSRPAPIQHTPPPAPVEPAPVEPLERFPFAAARVPYPTATNGAYSSPYQAQPQAQAPQPHAPAPEPVAPPPQPAEEPRYQPAAQPEREERPEPAPAPLQSPQSYTRPVAETPRPAAPAPQPLSKKSPPNTSQQTAEEKDLEIPAFIRRKMM